MRVLLVEDNARLADAVAEGLSKQGFAVDRAATKSEAEGLRRAAEYDLILLDLGLPDGDGRDVVRSVRKSGSSVPILILTARSALGDRVEGLDSGADDYVVKPVELPELVARCRALLRRPSLPGGMTLGFAGITFDPTSRDAAVEGRPIEITRREAEVLEHLLRKGGKVVQRQRLESALYAFDDAVQSNALEACVSRLRRRLSEAGAKAEVHTVRGVGYALMAKDG